MIGKGLIALLMVLLLTAIGVGVVGAQSPRPRVVEPAPPIGRYQLVAQPSGTVFLVDTAYGRVWRYTVLTDKDGREVAGFCAGLTTCFYEMDRLTLQDSGRWKSDLVTTRRPTESDR